MTQTFVMIQAPPDLVIKLPEHGLDGEAGELLDLTQREIERGTWNAISLDASDAAFITLEGVGILVRLLKQAERAGIALDVTSPHPILEERLRRTGIIDWLVSGRS